jgi:hypothetical protein
MGGVCTRIVAVERPQFHRVFESTSLLQDLDALEADGMCTDKLGALYGVLTGRGYQPGFMSESHYIVYRGGEDGLSKVRQPRCC